MGNNLSINNNDSIDKISNSNVNEENEMDSEDYRKGIIEMIQHIENSKSLRAIFRITVKHYLHG